MKNFTRLSPDLAGAPILPELRWAWKMFRKWYAPKRYGVVPS
jgi:hypothetical protein